MTEDDLRLLVERALEFMLENGDVTHFDLGCGEDELQAAFALAEKDYGLEVQAEKRGLH